MKFYKIINPVYLDFLTPRDQITLSFSDGYVTVDGEKVMYIYPDGKKQETINWGWVVSNYLEGGNITEIFDESEIPKLLKP
jgi:hypothetical protein